MRVGLLFPDRNVRWQSEPDPRWEDRYRDLRLEPILRAMGGGDPEITGVCRQLLDQPLENPEEIRYRQDILRECLEKRQVVENVYEICCQAEEKRKNTWGRLTSPHLTTVYGSAADLLKIYMEALVEIRKVLEKETFWSRGLGQLSELLSRELSEAYLDRVRSLRSGIESREGMLISAGFGPFLQGVSYRKRKGNSRLRWMLQPSFTLGERDMQGAKDLELRQDRAINEAANGMAQAAGSLQGFVDRLRKELSFYLGGCRLAEALENHPLCFPDFGEERRYRQLYDGALALSAEAVPNTLSAGDQRLWLITGANQGGKTTFLRSVGLCQLMAQCGLLVCAEACRIPLRTQVFTHFGREEDRTGGKLEEELTRMSGLADRFGPGAMLLSNESFSSTNDRDGSEILSGIVRSLLEGGMEVFAVTHLQGFAREMACRSDVLSLRPERKENGERTYRLREEAPAPEAYAQDLCREIFRTE